MKINKCQIIAETFEPIYFDFVENIVYYLTILFNGKKWYKDRYILFEKNISENYIVYLNDKILLKKCIKIIYIFFLNFDKRLYFINYLLIIKIFIFLKIIK